MYDLILKNAKLIDGSIVDIAIKAGKIAELGHIDAESQKTIDLKGLHYVSAGWIDSHTHCFARSPIYHDEPDLIGVHAGVTGVVDAGSVGALDADEFYHLAQQSKTNVYSF